MPQEAIDDVRRTEPLDLFGLRLSLPGWLELVVLTLMLFTTFGLHNFLQEAIMQRTEKQHGSMLAVGESAALTLGGFFEFIQEGVQRKSPLTKYAAVGLCTFLSAGMSNVALQFINYPVKVVIRSSKVIPTMLVGTVWLRRSFSVFEYLSALMISLGLVLFIMNPTEFQNAQGASGFGVLLVSLSVCADAVTPNAQEELFKNGSSRKEVVFHANAVATFLLTVMSIFKGDVLGLIKIFVADSAAATLFAVYMAVSYFAIVSHIIIVKRFGAVTAVIIASIRKAMTIAISFIFFPKPFSWFHLFGGLLMLGGIVWSAMSKSPAKESRS